MRAPIISVIMPVRNMEEFILSSIDSICKQSLNDFELIIIDDASEDKTAHIIGELNDPRIIIISNEKHIGNYKCRNQGLAIARGKYICVMDADDLADSSRLLKQYTFMETNPYYVAAGSDIVFFSEDSPSSPLKQLRDEHQLKVHLLKDNVCTHPTLIIRKEIMIKHKIAYNDNYYYSADYDLLVQLTQIGAITNMPETLLSYRIHKNQISSRKRIIQLMYANQIRLTQLTHFKMRPSIDDINIHLSLMTNCPIAKEKLLTAEKWCNKLLSKNRQVGNFHSDYLYQFLEEQFIMAVKNAI